MVSKMKIRVMITGAAGQLGSELKELSGNFPGCSFTFTDINELDITNSKAVSDFFKKNSFDYLVNCAAYTAVDKAESDLESAKALNALAPGYLAMVAASFGIRLIHISTDFVFDGMKSTPYTEEDHPLPLSAYGKTKLDGEYEIKKFLSDYMIIRTSWLYSIFGNNFVKNMIRYGKERGKLNVVFDQSGTPTWAKDLAEAIMQIISKDHFKPGIYHYSNEGVTSWYDFAKVIMNRLKIKCELTPIRTADYPTPAIRPAYSVMDKGLFKKTFDLKIPFWQDSLEKCLKQIRV